MELTRKSTWIVKQRPAKAGQQCTVSFNINYDYVDDAAGVDSEVASLTTMDHQWYEDKSRKPTWTKHFPVVGQGIISFNIVRGTEFAIVVTPPGTPPAWQWLALEIHKDKAIFRLGQEFDQPKVLCVSRKKDTGYEANEKVSYWLSFDRDRLVVKYGKGYFMEETTLLGYDFLPAGHHAKRREKIRNQMSYLFSPTVQPLIKFYDCKPREELVKYYAAAHLLLSNPMDQIDEIDFDESTAQKLKTPEGKESYDQAMSIVDLESKVSFSRYPLVKNWAPLVLDSSKLTLFDLDQNQFIFSASLPQACQELYANVASSENIDLNWPPNTGQPKLSDAIRYSINTKGKILYEKLQHKASHEPNKKQTYLRVTLGVYRGNSPGIAYVLEIWPQKHQSPIHDHGNAYAIIKVIHGSIDVHVYNKYVQTVHQNPTEVVSQEPIKKLTISKGDVTWISPNWYQTHQLKNESSEDYCATIQCYQYGDKNDQHWPYFDFISDQNQIEDFLPDTDFDFIPMREKLLEEYSAHLKEEKEEKKTG